MEIGIIGLPKSGKTTLFNTLTRGRAETRAFGAKAAEPNVGIVRVPDKRLEGKTCQVQDGDAVTFLLSE